MEDRHLIFSRDGVLIDQLRTSAERGWALVTETSAQFSLSVYDPKCNPFTINYGNILLIQNSDGLPDWVGMIDQIGFDRGAVIVNAYTPERWFTYRRGPRALTLTGSAGSIFAQMIQYINGVEATPLAVGDINSRTGTMQETLRPTVIDSNLNRIVSRSGEGYRWRPSVTSGKLTIYADWFSNLVLDTGLILSDGYNISGDHPLTLSPPINDYLAFGVGSDWEKRITENVTDVESINDYGVRQASDSYNIKDSANLAIVANTVLNTEKQPRYSFPIAALNVSDTLSKLEPGALATFTKLVGQGFSNGQLGYLSYEKIIKSMVYSPSAGNVSLVI